MFFAGVVLLILGAVLVYGSRIIVSSIKSNPLLPKAIGIALAVIGFFMIMYGDFPQRLEAIRILKFIRIF